MADNFDDLFDSINRSPAYWMQVALLEFLQSLRAVRHAKGILSNKDLADRVGVSPPTLSRWLNGSENLTLSTMCRLATALGAAVHIHVSDNTIKGRWTAEAGELEHAGDNVSLDDDPTFHSGSQATTSVLSRAKDYAPKRVSNIADYMPSNKSVELRAYPQVSDCPREEAYG